MRKIIWVLTVVLLLGISFSWGDSGTPNLNQKETSRITGLLPSLLGNSPICFQEKAPAHESASGVKEKPEASTEEHRHTWEMPEVEVHGKKALKEEQLIGPNEQPRWTARRRFPTTRVYVIPEGKFEFEWWMEYNVPKNGDAETTYLYEFEMGLPCRLQLDLYQGLVASGGANGPFGLSQQSVELRWAMAKWGALWGNPTWYAEYTVRNAAPDKGEVKLLLGDELTSRWHWGINLVHEYTLNPISKREVENEITAGVAYSVIDSVFSAGLEMKAGRESALQSDGSKEWSNTLKLGPSLQIKPTPSANIQFAPLFGLTKESEKAQIWAVIGWEF